MTHGPKAVPRPLPSIESVRCFFAAAQHLNFRRGAAAVGLTPTAFSERIRMLERELGAVLFNRTSRRVELTPAGQSLLPVAEQALAGVQACVEAVAKPEAVPVRLRRPFAPDRAVRLADTFSIASGTGVAFNARPHRKQGDAMRRISMLLMMVAGLLFWYGSAEASTVKVTGTVDWTALTHFTTAKSGEVVFVDITDFDNLVFTVVPLTKISSNQSKYSVTLNGNTPTSWAR